MVYHDQNRVKSVGGRKVGDEVHQNLLERVGTFGGNGGKRGVGWVGVDLIGLACGTAGDELVDEGGHSRPPIILLEKGDGVEVTTMGTSERLVDVLYKVMAGGFRNVEAQFVIESAMVKVPVITLRVGEGNGFGIKGSEGIDDELVGRY